MPACALGAFVAILELPAFRSGLKMFGFLEEKGEKIRGTERQYIMMCCFARLSSHSAANCSCYRFVTSASPCVQYVDLTVPVRFNGFIAIFSSQGLKFLIYNFKSLYAQLKT